MVGFFMASSLTLFPRTFFWRAPRGTRFRTIAFAHKLPRVRLSPIVLTAHTGGHEGTPLRAVPGCRLHPSRGASAHKIALFTNYI